MEQTFIQTASMKHDIAFVMVYAGAHLIHVSGFTSYGVAERAEESIVEYVRFTQPEGDLTSFIVVRK